MVDVDEFSHFLTNYHTMCETVRHWFAHRHALANPGLAPAAGAEPIGFDWHAPLFQRPHHRPQLLLAQETMSVAAQASPEDAFRWRRHPALRRSTADLPVAVVEPAEEPIALRQTRLAAVRGVQAAQDGRIERAADWFTEAATDPELTLQDVPGFWECSRAGMQAAVEAYETAQRFRDASALAAIIRTRYRPRALAQPRTSTEVKPALAKRSTSSGD